MKRVFATFVVIVVAASVAYAGAKRITNWPTAIPGSETITLNIVDSTGWLTTDKFQIINVPHNQKYDKFIGSVWLANLTEVIADSVTGENNCDTLIVRYYAGTANYKTLLEVDTVTLPGTTFVAWHEDIWTDPTTWIGGDSTSAVVTPKLTGDWPFLMYDDFWIEYYVSDSAGGAGGGGGLTGTMYYWFRFIEDE